MFTPRTTVFAALLCLVATTTHAQTPDMQAGIAKTNAYIELMNRTLRASESWNRYASWANVKTGPTGKERIVYGLYSLYDVRELIEKARAAAAQPPAYPALDETVKRYIAAYEALAPLVTEADGYYERKDYMSDKMAGGKALHAKLAPAAQAFLTERKALERDMEAVKSDLDRRQLAAIEQSEGRKARWHVRNVMIEAKVMVDLLPSNAAPVVDLPAFDKALDRYAAAVKEFDAYSAATPNSFFVFESSPRNLLGKLREFRQKVGRTKGDARKAGVGHDLTWLINDYNMMVSTSQSATTFSR
ncbi:MAG TPA: YiiG family protein [Hyphomicrobiaceae bacterium]